MDFVDDWKDALETWSCNRSRGLSALSEFIDLTRACAKEWLDGRIFEATFDEHKFDASMAVNMHINRHTHVALSGCQSLVHYIS